MTPQKEQEETQYDAFKNELKAIIDLRHQLAKLSKCIDWELFEKKFEKTYAEKGRPGWTYPILVDSF